MFYLLGLPSQSTTNWVPSAAGQNCLHSGGWKQGSFPISLRIFQFVVIHTVKGFGIVSKVEVDVFLELSCFFVSQQRRDGATGLRLSTCDLSIKFQLENPNKWYYELAEDGIRSWHQVKPLPCTSHRFLVLRCGCLWVSSGGGEKDPEGGIEVAKTS